MTLEIMLGPAPEFTLDCDDLAQSAQVHYVSEGAASGTYAGTYTETGTFTLSPSLGDPLFPLGREVTAFEANFTIFSPGFTIVGTKTFFSQPQFENNATCAPGDVSSFNATAGCRYEAAIESVLGTFLDRGTCVVQTFAQGPFGDPPAFQGEFLENLRSELPETEPACPGEDDQGEDSDEQGDEDGDQDDDDVCEDEDDQGEDEDG